MDLLLIVILLALLATAFALLMGLFAMGGGGTTDKAVSTPLMWARVGLQGFTLLLLLAAMLLQGA
jgi:hypothetical protein